MRTNEREDEVAHREAEHAVGNAPRWTPPVSDQLVEEPVEHRPADLEQAPAPRGE